MRRLGGVHAVRVADAHVLVRLNPVTMRICDENKTRIYLEKRERRIPKIGGVEVNITIPVPPPPTKSHKTWESAKAVAWIPAPAIARRTRDGEVIWDLTTVLNKLLLTTSA